MATFILKVENARPRMKAAWDEACTYLQDGRSAKVIVEECRPTRTLEQNSKMWAMLTDIANQLQWPVDGQMEWLDPEEWKDILTAGLTKGQRVAAGIEGGFVLLGQHTKKMRVGQMCELIEFMLWFGAEKNVVWSNSDEGRIEEARSAA